MSSECLRVQCHAPHSQVAQAIPSETSFDLKALPDKRDRHPDLRSMTSTPYRPILAGLPPHKQHDRPTFGRQDRCRRYDAFQAFCAKGGSLAASSVLSRRSGKVSDCDMFSPTIRSLDAGCEQKRVVRQVCKGLFLLHRCRRCPFSAWIVIPIWNAELVSGIEATCVAKQVAADQCRGKGLPPVAA